MHARPCGSVTLGGRSARIALFLLQPSASGEFHDSSRSCTSLGVRTWIAGPSDDPVLEELHARYTCRGHRFRSRPRWCSRAQSARGPVTGRGPVVGRPAPRRPRAPAPAAASRLTADADRRDRLSVDELARAGPPDRAGWRSCFPGEPPAHAAARAALAGYGRGETRILVRNTIRTRIATSSRRTRNGKSFKKSHIRDMCVPDHGIGRSRRARRGRDRTPPKSRRHGLSSRGRRRLR